MRLSHYIWASLVLSLLLHVLMLLSLSRVNFPAPYAKARLEKYSPLEIILHPEPLEMPRRVQKSDSASGVTELKNSFTQAEGEKRIQELFQKEQLAPLPPEPTVRFAGIDKAQLLPVLPSEPPKQPEMTAPRPQILEIDLSKLPPERINERPLTPQVERVEVTEFQLPSLLPPGPANTVGQGAAPTIDVGIRFNRPTFRPPRDIPEDVVVGLPDMPAAAPGESLPPGLSENLQTDSAPSVAEHIQSVPFDEFVEVEVTVREDPSTGGGFFLATISANPRSESIREIAKDTLFIIDRSSSISPGKFTEFKTAVLFALDYLNPGDRFDIGSFSDKPFTFSRRCIPATAGNLERGREYVRKLTRGGMTDVFAGIQPFVKSGGSDTTRPLNIFLLTDGVSTVKNIYKEDVFLRSITGINPGNVSIFPFSAGKEANRELLDFLGFLNRGYSAHAETLPEVRASLAKFISNLSGLLIMDVQYMAPATLSREMYPRKVSHLYRNSPLRLFGRFPPSEHQLILTIVGTDAAGRRRDLVFRRRFDECPRAETDLGKQWAGQKILQLLADRAISADPTRKAVLNRQIHSLGTQFSLAIPY
ncbi:MAG: VWA domain-containing protein [Victivallales bacterium]|nr:VWA domain-containing protein [Victivallales bacterium]